VFASTDAVNFDAKIVIKVELCEYTATFFIKNALFIFFICKFAPE